MSEADKARQRLKMRLATHGLHYGRTAKEIEDNKKREKEIREWSDVLLLARLLASTAREEHGEFRLRYESEVLTRMRGDCAGCHKKFHPAAPLYFACERCAP